MPQEVLIISAAYAVVFIVAVVFLYRAFERRVSEVSRRVEGTPALEGRVERALAEVRAHQQSMVADFNSRIEERVNVASTSLEVLAARLAELERHLDTTMGGVEKSTRAELDSFGDKIRSLHERMTELARFFQDYQESTRTSLDRALEAMEKRWSASGSGGGGDDIGKIRRFKGEMPHYEEAFGELADRHREVSANARRIMDQHKALADKIANAKSDEERREFMRQSNSLFQSLGRAINSSRDLFVSGEETLRRLIQEMSPLFKVCEVCGEVHETLAICLNCGKKYCEECKGLQIGHCKECAPYVRPLHMEVGET